MEKDLEYLAAYNFMQEGYYDLPGLEQPGFLHSTNEVDASWQALDSIGSRLIDSPEVVHALADTVQRNIINVRGQAKQRAFIAAEVNKVNMLIDQQG